jgi:hypothetical protein
MFTKKFIFVPIHDGKHWSLIIICHPGMQDGTEPVLIHLDPMAGQKGEIQATVKQWGGGDCSSLDRFVLVHVAVVVTCFGHSFSRLPFRCTCIPAYLRQHRCVLAPGVAAQGGVSSRNLAQDLEGKSRRL